MGLEELKKSLVDNFDASWHTISRMVQRDVCKNHMIKVIESGKVLHCMGDVVKFSDDKIIIVVAQKTAKIITVMVQGSTIGKPSRARKNRIAKKKTRSWKRKI